MLIMNRLLSLKKRDLKFTFYNLTEFVLAKLIPLKKHYTV